MAPKTLDAFQTVLITGGGGGLGFAMAEYFVKEQGKKVIIAGRTESKLKEASQKLNDCPFYVMDTGKVSELKSIVDTITKEHPELDGLINNAGVQRPLEVKDLDLEKADNEIDINIRGPLHLFALLLPHFAKQKSALVVNVSSVLGLLPTSLINPVYNGTKSFIHFWTMVQRTQLAKSHPNIRVVELAPPSVGTDLHRERENPDDNKPDKGAKASISVEQFIKEVAHDFADDKDEVGAGKAHDLLKLWQDTFGAQYTQATSGGK